MTTADYFKPEFIEQIMQETISGSTIKVLNVTHFELDSSASILTTLNAGHSNNEIGHYGLQVRYSLKSNVHKQAMVMKIKPHGSVTSNMLMELATAVDKTLGDVYKPHKNETGFYNTHKRELEIYKNKSHTILPQIFGSYEDTQSNRFIILMESLLDTKMLNTVMQPEQWTAIHIKSALSSIASWHAQHILKSSNQHNELWGNDLPSKGQMLKLQSLWTALLNNAVKNLPDVYKTSGSNILYDAINNIASYWSILEKQPVTLVHNDFNPRNLCFKNEADSLELCAYDWELATFHVPHYDVVEFLSFVLTPQNYDQRAIYIEHYRKELHKQTGLYEHPDLFNKVLYCAALDFGLHRLGMYAMAHTVNPYPFLPRVIQSYFDFLLSMQQYNFRSN